MEGTFLQDLIQRRQAALTAKVQFNAQFATLCKYFYQIKQEYNPYVPNAVQGQYENDGAINGNLGLSNAKKTASALMGMTWKSRSGTFRFVPSHNIPDNKANKAYFNRINKDTSAYMERPRARFEQSFFKALLESIILGTTGMTVQSGGYDNPLKYAQRSVLSFYPEYDKDGEVIGVMIDYHLSATELFGRYGASAGKAVNNAITSKDYEKRFVITERITPRTGAGAKAGKLSMPYASYVFMPYENLLLEEGGYESLPLKILFHDKLEYESYGRGLGMDALPTIVQANVCAEILAVGGESLAIPPLGMYDNGSLAGQAVNLSSGALNVFNVAGTVPSERPIFPLYEVGDLRVLYEWLSSMRQEIAEYFLLDKLYDLNAQQRMTLGEAMLRDQIRSDALSPIFTNIMAFLVELIERSVDILFSMGLLGVEDPENMNDPKVIALLRAGYKPFKIPDEIAGAMRSGLDWYEIEFISPASRIMNSEELNSSIKFISAMGEMAAVSPEFLDTIDPDGTATKFKELFKADAIMVRTPEEIQNIRNGRAQMQAQIAQLQAQVEQAKANQLNSQAAASRSQALGQQGQMGGMM